jgi:osmoprotectant transport system ATP-binding protein
MVRLERVTKVFGASKPAVSELSLDVGAGEVVCLVGPSGCGKTTTLRMINRLVEPTSGRVLVGGRDVRTVEPHELRRGIGYVIQQVGLFAHRTVRENVATVPRLLDWERPRIASRVEELMNLVGLDAELGQRYPAELSGGQQQRVGVARALAADPPILLMDEPFGAVDPIVRTRLQDELLSLQERLHKTIVFVTHDIDEAIKLGDRIVVMNVGGIVEQIASPVELLAHPANDFVANFVGSQRLLRRLGLIAVRDVELDDVSSASGAPDVPANATLLDALQAIVAAGTSVARVVDGDRPIGALTLSRIAGELR